MYSPNQNSTTNAAEINILGVTPATVLDTDGDGLTDVDEIQIYYSDPERADTDDDQLDDGEEVLYWGTEWSGDIDSDGVVNLLDNDSDGDLFIDGLELTGGYDPGDPGSHPIEIKTTSPEEEKTEGLETSGGKGGGGGGGCFISTVPWE